MLQLNARVAHIHARTHTRTQTLLNINLYFNTLLSFTPVDLANIYSRICTRTQLIWNRSQSYGMRTKKVIWETRDIALKNLVKNLEHFLSITPLRVCRIITKKKEIYLIIEMTKYATILMGIQLLLNLIGLISRSQRCVKK